MPDSKKERGALQYFCKLKSRHSIPTSQVLLARESEMVVFDFNRRKGEDEKKRKKVEAEGYHVSNHEAQAASGSQV